MARLSLLLFVVVIAVVAPGESFLKDLLFDKAKDALLEDGNTEILDKICNFRVTPRLQRWELYFRGDVWCPGWTSIRGESFTRSRTRVVLKAVADFAKKAVEEGIMTEEDAQPLYE